MRGIFTVAGQRVRSASERRYVAFRVTRVFDGVSYTEAVSSVRIEKRSDNLGALRVLLNRQGFHSSRYFVVIDTTTGEEV